MGWLPFLQKDRQKDKQRAGTSDEKAFLRPDDEPVPARRARRKTGKDAQAADPVLPEKKRARRRLIGAAALVLATVIGLPMLLDSEPKPLADDVAIDIPAKDRAFLDGATRQSGAASASTTVPAASLDKGEQLADPAGAPTDAAASSAHPAASTASSPSAGATLPSSAQPAPALAAPASSTASHLAKSTPTAEARALRSAEQKAEPASPAKADNATTAHSGGASEKPDMPRQESAKAGEQKGSKFVVQVAALASQDKVNALQGRLKSAGVHSYTQKVATHSGDRIRVRIGPFTNRDDAERMRVRLAKLGLRSSLLPV